MFSGLLTPTSNGQTIDKSPARRREFFRVILGLLLIPTLIVGVLNVSAKDPANGTGASTPQGKRSWKSRDGNIAIEFDMTNWDFYAGGSKVMAAYKKQDLMLLVQTQPDEQKRSVPELAAVFQKSFEEGARKSGETNRVKWLVEQPKKENEVYPFTIDYQGRGALRVGQGRWLIKSNTLYLVMVVGTSTNVAARNEAIEFEKAVTFPGAKEMKKP